jgi:type I restriction enzyme R subunit
MAPLGLTWAQIAGLLRYGERVRNPRSGSWFTARDVARILASACMYKATVALVRAYAAIADDLEAAGYTSADVVRIKRDQQRYLDLREIIRHAANETIDLKAYEADMRHLIDTYINAAEPRKISPFGDIPLLELIVKSGIADAIRNLPSGIRKNKDAVAETIANNVRSKIIKEHLNDPAYYDRMSALLEEILADLKAKRVDYEEYLRRIAELAKQVQRGQAEDTPEALKASPARRALYNNLANPQVLNVKDAHIPANKATKDARLALALAIDDTVKRVRPDDWRGHQARENEIKRALLPLLNDDPDEVERVFQIILQQREY